MSRVEKIPLKRSTSRGEKSRGPRRSTDTTYLLLSMPVNEEKTFLRKLDTVGNYSGIIVAVSVVVIVVLLIVGITYHADVTQLNANSSKDIQKTPSTFPSNHLRESSGESREIDIPLGKLKGYEKKSRKGRNFLAFYKVPYAKPPVGDLRFKDPQPVEKWDGVRDYKKADCQCIQLSKHSTTGEASGDEDCLYTNIYVPALRDDADLSSIWLPTMIYVHGGGFGDGNGSRYGPEYFMDEDIVLLTFEFRVGLFGFLNTGDRESSGNMGFKDQVEMLRWTKTYIKYFSGDPNRVTIFGNSAGAFSIGFLMISPMANGLFQRAISQSGTSLTETYSTIDLTPEVTKEAVAKTFNCSLKSSTELLQCLRKIDAREIAILNKPDIKFALTIEKGFNEADLSNIFMSQKPYDLLKSGKVSRVPYIIGIGATEYISMALGILMSEKLAETINSNFSQVAPKLLEMDLAPYQSNKIKEFYFGNKNIGMETERNLTNMFSDRIMVHGSKVAADFHSQFSDTYLYYMSKRPKKSYSEKIFANFADFDSSGIVSHADEIQFLFPYYGYPYYSPSDTEYFPFSEFLVKLWAHFAATGNPWLNAETEKWKHIDPNDTEATYWFELNDQVGFTMVLKERMNFWDKEFTHKQLLYEL